MIKLVHQELEILRSRNLKNDYYAITLGPFKGAARCRPGHFVHVKLPASPIYLRRAMSVAGVNRADNSLEFIFKAIGRGTRLMATAHKGDKLDIIGPLGNGFTLPRKSERAVLVSGGIGFPPPLYLATDLVERGYDPKKIDFYYGGRSRLDIIEQSRIKKLGVNFYPTTDDGSFGTKGLVTHLVEAQLAQSDPKKIKLYACGPEPMLKAVNELGLKYGVAGQLSLEAPMPCGVGICLGCVVNLTKGGHARVCVEGPVFQIGEVAL